jgi:hypothetical protein
MARGSFVGKLLAQITLAPLENRRAAIHRKRFNCADALPTFCLTVIDLDISTIHFRFCRYTHFYRLEWMYVGCAKGVRLCAWQFRFPVRNFPTIRIMKKTFFCFRSWCGRTNDLASKGIDESWTHTNNLSWLFCFPSHSPSIDWKRRDR